MQCEESVSFFFFFPRLEVSLFEYYIYILPRAHNADLSEREDLPDNGPLYLHVGCIMTNKTLAASL